MRTNYEAILKQNIENYGKKDAHLNLLADLYADRTHFIFEVLQNAEDARATFVRFEYHDGELRISHNGRPFSESDVVGICSIAESTKKDEVNSIGKFGIGFKSVYAYTEAPHIHSGEEHFKIEKYVRPYAIEGVFPKHPATTLFILPFKANIRPEEKEQIVRAFEIFASSSILFLRSIERVDLIVESKFGRTISSSTERGTYSPLGRLVTLQTECTSGAQREQWLVFSESVRDEFGSTRGTIELAFLYQDDKIVRTESNNVVVYFPTQVPTNLGFVLQGPFRTTPSRDTIPIEDAWNTKLIKQASELLKEVVKEAQKFHLLSTSFLESLPIRDENFRAARDANGKVENMFFAIADELLTFLRTFSFVPTISGTYIEPENVRFPGSEKLRDLLSTSQLQSLFNDIPNLDWISDDISESRSHLLSIFLKKKIGVREIDGESFTRRCTENGFLEKQTDEWMARFYGFLAKHGALWSKEGYKKPAGILRNKPFVRLSDGSHRSPFHADGKTPAVFLPSGSDGDDPVIKNCIAEDSLAREFFIELGISERDLHDTILTEIVPRYQKQEHAPSHAENAQHVRMIVEALKSNKEKNSLLLEKLRETPFLLAQKGNFEPCYKRGEDIYFRNDHMELYSGNDTLFFLARSYSGVDASLEQFKKLRVEEYPRRVPVIESGTQNNYTLDSLENFFESFCKCDSVENKHLMANALWRILAVQLSQYSSILVCDRTPKGKQDSKLAQSLKAYAWLPTNDGTFKMPSEIKTDELPEEYLFDDDLVAKLKIEKSILINQAEKDARKKVLSELGTNDEEFETIKRNMTEIKQVLSNLKSKQKLKEFPNKPVINPDKNTDAILEEWDNAPLKVVKEKFVVGKVEPDKVDTEQYLRGMYETTPDSIMRCQICKEAMPFQRPDGKDYFEAVEISNHLKKEIRQFYLALCPICAAKFKIFVKMNQEHKMDLVNAIQSLNEDEVVSDNKEPFETPLKTPKFEASVTFGRKHLFEIWNILHHANKS
jgi:hypothetical protein